MTSRRESRNESVAYSFNEIKFIPHYMKTLSSVVVEGSLNGSVTPTGSRIFALQSSDNTQGGHIQFEFFVRGAPGSPNFCQRVAQRYDNTAGVITFGALFINQFSTPNNANITISAAATGLADSLLLFTLTTTGAANIIYYKITVISDPDKLTFIDSPYAGKLV